MYFGIFISCFGALTKAAACGLPELYHFQKSKGDCADVRVPKKY